MSEILQYNRNGSLSNKLEDNMSSGNPRAPPEGSWDFWNQVYSNPDMRTMVEEKPQETSMSELLRSSSLCRAEVVVVNVPRLSASQHALIRSLLQKDLCTNVPILEVEILPRKWVIRFYRRDDAIRVQRVLQGHAYRNRILAASISDVAPVTPIVPPIVPCTPRLESGNPNWSLVEWIDILAFKSDLMGLLSRAPQGLTIGEVLAELRPMRRRGVVPATLDQWPTALIRMFAPQVRMTGRYLSLSSQGNLSALMRKAASEGTARAVLEQWEPMLPNEIRSDAHIIDYTVALLAFYGPQHIEMDVPIRVLATTLSSNWPNTSKLVAEKVTGLSPHFVIMDDVLYLTSNIRHRRLLLEHVQPTPHFVKQKTAQRPFPRQ